MVENRYQVCSRCVMDTTDPEITFDENGVCNHCHYYDKAMSYFVPIGDNAKEKLNKIVNDIKKTGKNGKYDCVIGVSGGVDSTYTAYMVVKLGLRPLAVHLDNGWDSELAVKNIEHILKKLNIDLFTYVIDWEEFKDLQIAFLKASTPDSEIPSDHAIIAILYRIAKKNHIKYLITGTNYRTETHLPAAWSQGHSDWKYIKSIHKRFGSIPLKTFPRRNIVSVYLDNFLFKRVNILDYIDYHKNNAMKIIERELDWKYYGGKHYESIYTRFYQGYILPKKFNFDKRKSHLSSLTCSKEITRDDALLELKKETYPVEVQKEDRTYVIKKLGLSEEEFDAIMRQPTKTFWDYPSFGKWRKKAIYRIALKWYRLISGRAL
jgi:N-acetyl sugar amidotransferase